MCSSCTGTYLKGTVSIRHSVTEVPPQTFSTGWRSGLGTNARTTRENFIVTPTMTACSIHWQQISHSHPLHLLLLRGILQQDYFGKGDSRCIYYPWYGNDFHRGGGYLRKELGQIPALGEYDDSTRSVVRKHLQYSRQANINLWVTSWWGRYSREDNTTRTVILPEIEGTDHKVAVLYESTGLLDENDGTRSIQLVTG